MQKNVSDGLPLPQRYGAIATIVIGISMAVLDGAIANVALPTIAKDLNASPASSIWIVNAYQIAIVISLLSLSFLGDMFGYRRVYQCGLVVFTLTSLFCALSDSLHTLTLARIAQGFGGAALMSVNTALIRLIYPQRHLGRGMGINSFIVAVSSAAGPTIAAAILSVASWQWLFAINVPLGIVAIFFALRYLPENGPKSTMPRFDLPSAVMNALTFGLLYRAERICAGTVSVAHCRRNRCHAYHRLFLCTTSAGAARAATSGGFATYSAVFAIHLYLHLLVLRPDAGAGCAAVLFAERDWPFRSGDRLAAHALAAGNHGDGPAGRLPY
ncbi:MFS transporter [Enterobacter hormaechei]|uniref:MFS transporter n=1 Tax=Enterobacter hormaechei TaxID=158836 RepID=UPI003BC21F37